MATKSNGLKNRRTHTAPKTILKLPDLDQAKSAVLNSLSSKDAQRGYRHAIDEFVEWYCSEPRLSFSRTVVLRYRMHLESRSLAPGTINLRLGAVRRLAYEAADCGLLSPGSCCRHPPRQGRQEARSEVGQLAHGGASQYALANAARRRPEGKTRQSTPGSVAGVRLAAPRGSAAGDAPHSAREEHWAIIDLHGKAGHTRTVPVPH